MHEFSHFCLLLCLFDAVLICIVCFDSSDSESSDSDGEQVSTRIAQDPTSTSTPTPTPTPPPKHPKDGSSHAVTDALDEELEVKPKRRQRAEEEPRLQHGV
jgi:hypothetical protein